MANDSDSSAPDTSQPIISVGGQERDDRPGEESPRVVRKTRKPARQSSPVQVSEQALAVLDDDSKAVALTIEQPKRGAGSRMPEENYKSIVLLLREGVPVVKLSHRFGVSTTTIHELKARHADIVPSHRDVMAGKSENLREVLSDQMLDTVLSGRMSPNQYAFTYGVVSTNYLTETGQNTQKHAVVVVNVGASDLSGLLSGIKATKPDRQSGASGNSPKENSIDV